MRICRRSQGREGTWRGRWLKRGRPGDLRNPLEKEGHACAWLSAEAHCPQGADGRGQAMLSGPRSRWGSGWAWLIPGGVGSRWGRGRGGRRTLNYSYPLLASPGRRWLVEARPITWQTCGSQQARHFRLV